MRCFPVSLSLCAILLAIFSGILFAGTAQVSIESLDLSHDLKSQPLFGDYYYRPDLYRDNFVETVSNLDTFFKERERAVQKYEQGAKAELQRLEAEHDQLMLQNGMQGYTGEAGQRRWALAMYGNITRQAQVREEASDNISRWDEQHWVDVQYVTRNGRRYITSLVIHRQGFKGEQPVMASIH